MEVDTLSTPTRVIAVPLSESEWRAFLALEPQPVAWVLQQIRERLKANGREVGQKASAGR